MPDAHHERKTTSQIKTPNRSREWTRFVIYVKSGIHHRRAKKGKVSPVDMAAILTAIATVLLAITSACTVWILINQLREMHAGGEDTHALAVAADRIDAAADSFSKSSVHINQGISAAVTTLGQQADQTRGIAQTSKDALVSVQRAFVFPDPTIEMVYERDGKTPQAVRVTIKWQNSGSTPTKNLRVHTNRQAFIHKIPDDFDFHDIWSQGIGRTSELFIAPKGSIGTTPMEIPSSKVIEIARGRAELYFWGWAKYSDVFKGTDEHITRYCYRFTSQLVHSPTNPVEGRLEFNMVSCEKNNCYDDECKVK